MGGCWSCIACLLPKRKATVVPPPEPSPEPEPVPKLKSPVASPARQRSMLLFVEFRESRTELQVPELTEETTQTLERQKPLLVRQDAEREEESTNLAEPVTAPLEGVVASHGSGKESVGLPD